LLYCGEKANREEREVGAKEREEKYIFISFSSSRTFPEEHRDDAR